MSASSDIVSPIDALANHIEAAMLREIGGPVLTGERLVRALAYPSQQAFRQAVARGTVPIPVFPLENRRGTFALVTDVAKWLARKRVELSSAQTEQNEVRKEVMSPAQGDHA